MHARKQQGARKGKEKLVGWGGERCSAEDRAFKSSAAPGGRSCSVCEGPSRHCTIALCACRQAHGRGATCREGDAKKGE